jgi:hypothetical protein
MIVIRVLVTLHVTGPHDALPFDSHLACAAAEWQLLNEKYNLLSLPFN